MYKYYGNIIFLKKIVFIEKLKWNLIIFVKNFILLIRWIEDYLLDIVNYYKLNLLLNVVVIMIYLIYLFYNNDM